MARLGVENPDFLNILYYIPGALPTELPSLGKSMGWPLSCHLNLSYGWFRQAQEYDHQIAHPTHPQSGPSMTDLNTPPHIADEVLYEIYAKNWSNEN